MHQDRIRWNAKYEEMRELKRPSPLVRRYCRLAPGGRALDVAAGLGRNSLFLAERGFTVLAVDIADKAVAELQRLGHSRIIPVQSDLDHFPFHSEAFDLIVNCRFLDRRLFPLLQESLVPSGLLLFESALESSLPHVSQPRNREYLLRSNELLQAFLKLHILYYEEQVRRDSLCPGQASCLARLAACKGPANPLADNSR